MALVAGRWFVVYDLVESSGRSTLKRFELASPADYAAAVINEAAFRLDLSAVTDLVIKGYHIFQEFSENALVLPANVEMENQAVLAFQLANPNKTGSVAIPGAASDCFVDTSGANRDIVDTGATEVTNFASNFLAAGTALMYLSDGEQAQALIGGKRRHVGNPRS